MINFGNLGGYTRSLVLCGRRVEVHTNTGGLRVFGED